MDKRPLISVIVPVYGTEKYLKKCLDSILNQTYKEIELIIVNDASKDNSEEIIMEYMNMDERIKYVRHAKNRGLFQARISGAEEATGEYIAFVDSDDYISCDFYRLLVKKAVETGADMVLADFCLEDENGNREYYNLDPVRLQDLDLHGDEVLKTFMEQKGLFYSWQLVWNKLIKRELWEKCERDYGDFTQKNYKLSMLEHLLMSCSFWKEATRVVNIHNVLYFSHGTEHDLFTWNEKSLDKGLMDTFVIFAYIEVLLKKKGVFSEYFEDFQEWKKYYARIFVSAYEQYNVSDKSSKLIASLNANEDKITAFSYDDKFFYHSKTTLKDTFKWYEEIKEYINSDQCKFFSFDIFDTLIVRPFFFPTDIFCEMNDYFIELTGANSLVNFSDIRIESEKKCRELLKINNPMIEEVTLEQIYECMQEDYALSKKEIALIMQKEIEMEIKYCVERKTAKDLYELALYKEKKILITSDMYLPKAVVQKILMKNGYNEVYRLYLSSEIKLGKWSKNLFKYILKDLEITDYRSIGHIGDNWISDVENPRDLGIVSFHITKPTDLLQNINPGIYSGECFQNCYNKTQGYQDGQESFWNFLGLRKLLAIAANKIFDNPYVSFNDASDFNADPYIIGYFPVGFHLFAVTKWLTDGLAEKEYETIHFAARDGYILKKIYDIYTENMQNMPKSKYTFFSRKALALLDVNEKVDLYSLISKMNISKATPKSVCKMFFNSDQELEKIKERVEQSGFVFEGKFCSRRDWDKFIKWFSDNMWDAIDHSSNKLLALDYFKEIIGSKDALFDIGYSGRVEAALKSVLGYSLDSFYVYSNNDQLNRRMRYFGFNTKLFYDYKPAAGVMIREHVFSQLGPSTVGYDFQKKEPIFEEYKVDYQSKFITSLLQEAALDFTKDVISFFGENIKYLYSRYNDLSRPFEYYLCLGKKVDRNIFSSLVFEDDFGEGKVRAVDFWGESINRYIDSSLNVDYEKTYLRENNKVFVPKRDLIRLNGQVRKKKASKRTAIFIDEIVDETIPTDEKFSKCANNLNNLICWDSIKSIISPVIIPAWFMTRDGGFNASDYEVYLSTHLSSIKENEDFSYLQKVLDRIGDKILLPIGIGLSTKNYKNDFRFHQESLQVLMEIAERCKTVGVYGEYTAEILNKNGIKNIRIIGNPILYKNVSTMKKIAIVDKCPSNVCASFKPFYGVLSETERALLSYMKKNRCSLVEETPLELQFDNIGDMNLFIPMKKWEENRAIFFKVPAWRNFLRKHEFCIGMNFYNNVLALQEGIPSFFITDETSTQELCDYMKLPYIELKKFDVSKQIDDYYQASNYSEYIKILDDRMNTFFEFLSENCVEFNIFKNGVIEK